jgi:hypothetical protein
MPLIKNTKKNKAATNTKRLFKKLREGTIPIEKYNSWGIEAGNIDKLHSTTLESCNFWKKLLHLIYKVEIQTKKETHKGLIYFKIAGRKLQMGEIKTKSTNYYLNAAVKEDRRFYRLWHLQSAYKVSCILKAYIYFLDLIKNKQLNIVKKQLDVLSNRVGQAITNYYDSSIFNDPIAERLASSFFTEGLKLPPGERLLFIRKCYDAAGSLISRSETFRRANLVPYGISKAIIVLCGSSLEGIFLAKKKIRNKILKDMKRKNKNASLEYANLGNALTVFLPTITNKPDLIVGLIIIWWSRNIIHSERSFHLSKKTKIIIDLNFANFIWQTTNSVLVKLSTINY